MLLLTLLAVLPSPSSVTTALTRGRSSHELPGRGETPVAVIGLSGDFDPGERQPYREGPADSDERHEYGRQDDYGADQPGGESFGRHDASQQDDYAGQQSDYAADQLDSASEERPGYRGRQQDYGQESGSVRGDPDDDSGDIGGQAGESESF